MLHSTQSQRVRHDWAIELNKMSLSKEPGSVKAELLPPDDR